MAFTAWNWSIDTEVTVSALIAVQSFALSQSGTNTRWGMNHVNSPYLVRFRFVDVVNQSVS